MPKSKMNHYTMKNHCIRAIITRLKPNVYIDSSHYWESLEKGLKKLNLEEIDALEALIMGKTSDLLNEDI